MRKLKILFVIIGVIALIVVAIAKLFSGYEAATKPNLSGSFERHRIESNGIERSYFSYIPKHLSANAIVFVLHGSNGDGLAARAAYSYRFDQLADEHGFIVVYPNGFEQHWNGCRIAGPYAANTQNINDTAFLDQLKNQLRQQYQITGPSFLTGLSNGGHMVLRTALEQAATFDSYGVVIANMPAPSNNECEPKNRPVSIAFMNGTSDPLNPYEGGEVAFLGVFLKRGQVLSSHGSIDYWLNLAGINDTATIQKIPDIVGSDDSRIDVYSWQSSQHIVRLFKVNGGGHTVPSARAKMPKIAGGQNHDSNAADLLWAFFNDSVSNRQPTYDMQSTLN